MTPSEAPAGKQVALELHIGHGCDGAPTNGLEVQLPDSARNVAPAPIKGWTVQSGAHNLTWSGGPLPDHQEQVFPFTATLYGQKGDKALFKAIQKCEGGSEIAWIQSSGGASESENPAPAVTLTSTAAANPGVAGEAPAGDPQAQDDQVAEEDAAATGDPTATAGDAEDGSDDDGGSGKSLLLIIVVGLAIGTVAGIIVRGRRMRQQ
jgi:uncharacterized protein YcnI